MIGGSKLLPMVEGLFLWPSALLYFTGIYVIPLVCAAYLLWRIWQSKRDAMRVILLGAALVLLSFTLPFLERCIIVMMD